MNRKIYIETYGCQMNNADSEMIIYILSRHNNFITKNREEADVILLNTCSVRSSAEQRVLGRIEELQYLRKQNPRLIIGIIGCMAKYLGDTLYNKNIDFLVGPDSYRNIDNIIEKSQFEKVTDILLSATETYEDIISEKSVDSSITAFVPIMRGCENFCSYCVVPYVRGKERCRSVSSITDELSVHSKKSKISEIILLGQNVNSYSYTENNKVYDFPDLLQFLSQQFKNFRFRFITSHPKDISDKLLYVIAENENICRSVHFPMQSGSTEVLKRMNRKYTREQYLERINAIKTIIPECTVSTDIISGFCGETDDDHKLTLSAMKEAEFFQAFMFKYNERPGTPAAINMKDDITEKLKTKRLTEIINLQQQISYDLNRKEVGKTYEVLVESVSKRSKNELMGRTSQNKVVVFAGNLKETPAGKYVNVTITGFTSATLKGVSDTLK